MKTHRKARHGLRNLLVTSSCLSALVIATPAFAQEPPAPAPQAESGSDVIVVTGSRISTDSATSAASPVQVIGGDDIATSGETDVSVLLRESPSLQSSVPATFSAFNAADTEDSDLGVGLLNLRSLGIERTLVLQNGRRHVPAVAGQAAVDVSTIPVSLLDRVEVLTGGASSIYGADAVSGVVNFILRSGRDFDGMEVRAQAGISSENDAEEFFLSIADGFDFAEGRGDFVYGLEYANSSPVYAGDRDFAGSGIRSFVPNSPELAAFLGVSPDAANTFAPNLTLPISSRYGIIAIGDGFASAFGEVASSSDGTFGTIGAANVPVVQIFDNGTLRPYNAGDIFVDPFNAVGGDAIATTPDLELILPESERFLFNANSTYAINDSLNFFTETKFVYSNTYDSIQVNGFNDDIPISLDNPYIPAALRAQLDALADEGIDPVIAMSRDTLDRDVLPKVNAERTTFRVVSGFSGELPFGWDYELSYNFGRSDAKIKNSNTRLDDRFFAAVDAVIDPDTGQTVCRSDLDPTAIPPVSPFPAPREGFFTFSPGDGQCKPINLFGENAITGAGADFAFVSTMDNTTVQQQAILATLSGDTEMFFSLPGGPIGWAVGAEWRKEKSEFFPDPLNTAGFTFGATSGGPTFPSGGGTDVTEAFIEVRAPILADQPFVELLEVSGSARTSDYSTIGETETWSVGGRYSPHPWITLRGTIAEAVRAPNIGELFAPLQPASIGADDDPCNPNFINAGTEFRAANCAEFVAPGYNSTDYLSAFVSGVSGGNVDLLPETAKTKTFGFVFEPEDMLTGLRVIVDYYDIEITGAVDALAAFDIASACVDLPSVNNQYCAQIDRDPTNGFITGFRSGQINLGSLETKGVDFSATYDFVLPGTWGEMRVGAAGTNFLKYDEFQDPTDLTVFEDRLGEFAIPEWIVNFSADWMFGDFTFGWNGRYEHEQLLPGISNADIESDPDFADPFSADATFVHDLSVDYQFNEKLKLYGGVNNVLNEEPLIGTLSRPAGPRGTFFFVGLEVAL
ncbi:MAG: TonB-dependent receptor [Hyphomonadaceae bacterium]|nr:TonB-dependent receptor [Hyphomonadaceae bacterium]